jgi:hypothetical protein
VPRTRTLEQKLATVKASAGAQVIRGSAAIGPDCPRCGKPWPWVTVRRAKRLVACHHDVEFTVPAYGSLADARDVQ